MFFTLSKVIWYLLNPGNLFLLLVVAGAALSWTKRQRGARLVMTGAAVFGLGCAMLPFAVPLTLALENRFPVPARLPDRIDGIVVLGGLINPYVSQARGQVALGGSVERLTEAARLAARYPSARIVYSGGSGDVFRQDLKEADFLPPVLGLLGLEPGRVILENRSRNTFENAVLSLDLVRPRADETWILMTSAAHMPRSVGCFRKAGWKIIPYPVDFGFEGRETLGLEFDFNNLWSLGSALHEWAGLAVYRLTGRTDALFPGPEPEEP